MEELTQFEFEEDFEQKLLAFFVRNLKFFKEIPEMKPNYFVSKIRGDIYQKTEEYIKRYGELPSQEVLKNEIQEMYITKKKKDQPIDTYWEVLADLFNCDLSGELYTRDKVLYFIRGQEMANVLKDGAKLIMDGKDLSDIPVKAQKALSIGSKEIVPRKACITLSEMFEKKIEEPEFIIRTDTGTPILEPGTLGYLVASYKVGKTLFAQQLTLCLAKGADFLGFEVKKPYKVLYVRFELSEYHFRKRFLKINSGIDGMIKIQPLLYPDPLRNFNLLNQKDRDWLHRQVDKYEAEVLILDPLYKLTNLNLAKPESADPFNKATDEFREKFPSLVTILPHHQVKGIKDKESSWDSTYGPMQLFAHMDFEWKLTTEERNVRFKLSFLSNSEPIGDLILERDPEHLIYKVTEKGKKLEKDSTDQAHRQTMEAILKHDGRVNQTTFQKSCKEVGIGKDLFKRLIGQVGMSGYAGDDPWMVSKVGKEVFYEPINPTDQEIE
jgi:hypothetical protein